MHADLHACLAELSAAYPGTGIATDLPVPGAALIRNSQLSAPMPTLYRPSACFVAAGEKTIQSAGREFRLGPGSTLVVGIDLPTVGRVTRAPFLGLAVDLDPVDLAAIAGEMDAPEDGPVEPLAVAAAGPEILDAALRLARAARQPETARVLGPGITREIAYWLLSGPQGPALRGLFRPGTRPARLARALDLIGQDPGRSIPVAELAAAAGMSASSFHGHFRALTGRSPLRYQKELRLHEARRRLLSGAESAAAVAYAMGYESASQFSRDYARLFGAPPARSVAAERAASGAGTGPAAARSA